MKKERGISKKIILIVCTVIISAVSIWVLIDNSIESEATKSTDNTITPLNIAENPQRDYVESDISNEKELY